MNFEQWFKKEGRKPKDFEPINYANWAIEDYQPLISAFGKIMANRQKYFSEIREMLGDHFIEWDKNVALSNEAWQCAVAMFMPDKFEQMLQDSMSDYIAKAQLMAELTDVGTLLSWLYTKHIYEFDADLYDAITKTAIGLDVEIPMNIFNKLPSWAIYVKFPIQKMMVGNDEGTTEEVDIYGFYVSIRQLKETKVLSFLIMNNGDGGFIRADIPFESCTLNDTLDKLQKYHNEIGLNLQRETLEKTMDVIRKCIALTLYICSEIPDIDYDKDKGHYPYKPQPVKIKNGVRIFPAQKAKIFKVGENISREIKKYNQTYKDYESSGKLRRAHIRCAHWHTYWTGKRDTVEEKAKLNWLPPTIVGIADSL